MCSGWSERGWLICGDPGFGGVRVGVCGLGLAAVRWASGTSHGKEDLVDRQLVMGLSNGLSHPWNSCEVC